MWCYRRRPFKVKDFQKMHDIILRYAKSDNWVWNQLLEDKSPSTIKRFGVRKLQDIDTGKGRKHVASGEITPETAMRDIWNIPIAAKQRVGYPTQKPVALYERMIKRPAINMTSCLTRSLAVARHLTQRTRLEGTG